jgi:hypothetical protein
MELYIQKTKIFDSGTNSSTVNNYITDSTKSWATNQYKDYYVFILSGTGAGSIAKITSNNATTLNFAALTISLDNTSIYQIVDFPYERVEMFQDEKVSVTSTIQNYSDIGKLFTDYSQSFTIPASPNNNAIFSHWYDNAVDNGYDARIRYNAYIEIETIPFKEGNVQLEKANKKNGYVESYTLTFYGNLTQLKDKFGDDKLNSLDYSSLNHNLTSTEIFNRVSTNSYELCYPLIGNNKRFEYLTANSSDVTTNTGAIKWDDLFPAVRITTILDFIQTKYGINFTGNFLNYGQFDKLYMYLKNMELPRAYNSGVKFDSFQVSGVGGFSEYNQTTNILTSNWTNGWMNSGFNRRLIMYFRVIPNTGFNLINYKVTVYRDDIIYKEFSNLSGDSGALYFYNETRNNDPNDHKYYVIISSQGNFDFKGILNYYRAGNLGNIENFAYNYGSTTTGQLITSTQNIVAYVPDIKVADFFIGLVKMFNLIITPINATTFNLEPLELYYQAGQIKDLTPFIYSDELDIEKPKLFKSIEFSYEKSENVLNNAFSGLFNRQYGDLTFDSGTNSESGKYEIKLPFENVMWEKTTGYNFITATLWNKDLQTYTPKPILMYRNALTDVSAFPIKLTTPTGYNSASNYVRFNNDIPLGATDLGYVHSINWGAEVSPWYLNIAPNGLYKRHYEQYITNLYNQKTRILKVKAKLEPQNLTNLRLNDRIIIRDNRYIINSFTTDLTTGEATFELINDYRVLGFNSVGYKFANIDLLNIDKEAQEIQIDVYKGMFNGVGVPSSSTGFVTWSSKSENEDFSLIIYVDENTSGVERTKNLEMKFEDFDGVVTTVEIPITQNL